MALNQQINSEQICDLNGHPLQVDAVVLLKSLDKLLTLGSYYSTKHEQYIQAAEKAAQAIVQAIQPRNSLSLEITSEGLMILGQKIHPNHRNVRQIHDLLVPLNIARLEFTTQLTAADLRQALEALQNHKLLLGKSNTFKEIVIQGLPPSVRTSSRNVLENDHAADDPASGLASVKDMMEEWSRGSGWSANEDESERLAREFMAMVTEILANLENSGEQSLATGESSGNTPVSSIDLEALRKGLQRLVEVNPSPKQLLELISHARSALDLSRDSSRADLVFQILRKDILAEPAPKSKRTDSSSRKVKYKLSVDQLVGSFTGLISGRETVPNPEHGASSDHMAICLYLLEADPPDSLKQSLLESLSLLLARPEIKVEDLDPCLVTIREALDSGLANRADDLLSQVGVALRRGQPEMMGMLWQRLQEKVQPEGLSILWPHLVNDILLGLGRQSAEASGSVLKWAGQISAEGAVGQLERLQAMPALQRDRAAGDLFKAPLCSLYPVHAALAKTRLAGWLGKRIHASMKARPFSPLVRALMAALEEFEPANLEFYLDLMAQSQAKVLTPELRLRSSVLLMGLLSGLPRTRRQEKWVPAALTSLAELEVAEAAPLLNEVLTGKWLVFFRAWPQPCRDAVRQAVAEGRGGHGQTVQ